MTIGSRFLELTEVEEVEEAEVNRGNINDHHHDDEEDESSVEIFEHVHGGSNGIIGAKSLLRAASSVKLQVSPLKGDEREGSDGDGEKEGGGGASGDGGDDNFSVLV